VEKSMSARGLARRMRGTAALASVLTLAGCMVNEQGGSGASATRTATEELVQTQSVLDATATAERTVPTITGLGYSAISVQPGRSVTQKRLLAIRAARMEAMRDLAEKIHGLKVEGQTSIAEMVVQNDSLRTSVAGTIRGARTVRIEPKGSDTYEVLLEIDRDMIDRLLRAARRG
jgi:hypothetical protein